MVKKVFLYNFLICFALLLSIVKAVEAGGRGLIEKNTVDNKPGYLRKLVRDFIKAVSNAEGYSGPLPRPLQKLVELQPDSVPLLIDLLNHHNQVVSNLAAPALELITGVPEPALDRKKLKNFYNRWWQTHKGKSRTEWLVEGARTDEPYRKELCLTLLASSGDTNALPKLVEFLEDNTLLDQKQGYRASDYALIFLQGITGEFIAHKFQNLRSDNSRKALIQAWKDWIKINSTRLKWSRRCKIFYLNAHDLHRRQAAIDAACENPEFWTIWCKLWYMKLSRYTLLD